MWKLADCGKTKMVIGDSSGYIVPPTATVLIQMVIKGPKGSCAIFDNVETLSSNHNMESKCKAVQAFMEFNNG